MPFDYAKRSYQTIHGSANCMAALAQSTKILGGCQRKLNATCRKYLKLKKVALNVIKRIIVRNSLQHLTKNYVS